VLYRWIAGIVHLETIFRLRIGHLVLVAAFFRAISAVFGFVIVVVVVVAVVVVVIFVLAFVVVVATFAASFTVLLTVQHRDPLSKGRSTGALVVLLLAFFFIVSLELAIFHDAWSSTGRRSHPLYGERTRAIGSVVVFGRHSGVVVVVVVDARIRFIDHSNVSECLGRLVHGPFVANIDVPPGAVCAIGAGAGVGISSFCSFQEAPPPVGLSLPDERNDLFHDRCLESLRCRLVFVVVFSQESIVEGVARMRPDALSPPAQDVLIGGAARRD